MTEKKREGKGKDIPESLLNAPHIIHLPVLLGDIFLADRDAGPSHAHNSDTVHVVLVEVDFKGTEVTLGPLSQTPFLHDLFGEIELCELADHVAIEDGKFAANMVAFELAGRAAGEGCDAPGVCEGVVQFLGCGAELV